MAPFLSATRWEPEGIEEIEGRPVQRYKLTLQEDKIIKKGLHPVALSGNVWVDKATAVRLLADIRCTLQNESFRKETQLKISRTKIGQALDISPPSKEKIDRK